MDDYNRLISAKVLDGYEGMLGTVPQPLMLGGKRMRKFVLAGSTEYDYPGTLSVGRMDGMRPDTLGGEFWKDFGNGFPRSAEPHIKQGGAFIRDADGNVRSVNNTIRPRIPVLKRGGDLFGSISNIGTSLAKKGIGMARGSGRRGSKKIGGDLFGDIGNIGKSVGTSLAKEGLKEGVRMAIKGSGRKGKMVGTNPNTYTPAYLLEGGALLMDNPAEFHSSVYPPALASYKHSFPRGQDAFGRGRDKPISKPKRTNARGAIVAEVMKKHGLSLSEASKFVKEKGLY